MAPPCVRFPLEVSGRPYSIWHPGPRIRHWHWGLVSASHLSLSFLLGLWTDLRGLIWEVEAVAPGF